MNEDYESLRKSVREATADLRKAIELAEEEIHSYLVTKGPRPIFVSCLVLRILDGARNCYYLLISGTTSYIEVIFRTMIEAYALILCIKDDDFIEKFIFQGNSKLRSLVEKLIKNGPFNNIQKSTLSSISKKAKEENTRTFSSANNVQTSDIVNKLDDALSAYYTKCAMLSHNDMNEMVSMYLSIEGDVVKYKYPDEYNISLIKILSAHIISLIYLTLIERCAALNIKEGQCLVELASIVENQLRHDIPQSH